MKFEKRTFFHKFESVLCILIVENAVDVCAANKIESSLELLFSLLQSLQCTLRYSTFHVEQMATYT